MASYAVHIAATPPPQRSRLLLLQYPSKPGTKSSKPSTLRVKPVHGIVEAHIPRNIQENKNSNEPDVQILAGKMTPYDPVYMVGTFRDNALHLSQLDSITQLRPQLPHLNIRTEDATDAVEDGRKFESRAVDVKLKNPREDNKQRNLNNNARLLHNIHEEPWQVYEYVDQGEQTAKAKFDETMHDGATDVNLKATLNNSEWLDKMSAPRDSGKGGLLAKLRGREREKARRKKGKDQAIVVEDGTNEP